MVVSVDVKCKRLVGVSKFRDRSEWSTVHETDFMSGKWSVSEHRPKALGEISFPVLKFVS